MSDSVRLGELLRDKRTEKGMSLREFGEYLSISHAYLNKLEKGCDPRSGKPIKPTIEALSKISAALQMNLDDFLGECGYYTREEIPALELNALAAEFVSMVSEAQGLTLNGATVEAEGKKRLETAVGALVNYINAMP